jgi:hypothetical protein
VDAQATLPEGAPGTTTIELHVGRRIIVVETDLLDDATKLVGRVTQTQAVL